MADFEFSFQDGLGRRYDDAAKGVEVLARDLGKSIMVASQALAQELTRFMDEVRRALVRRHSQPWNPGGSPAGALYRRRGSINDITTVVRAGRAINDITGVMTVPFPISVHEDGATVRARRSEYLTIPLPAALDARGIPIHPRARDWPSTFVQRSRAGNLLIFQRRGAEIVPLYVLKKEVRLPPRLGVQKTFEAGADFFTDAAIDAMVRAIMGTQR